MTPQPHRSFWLQEVAGDAPDAPPLAGHHTADVAIVGGGYVGLWTAIRLKEFAPACDVAVVEADICGGGASGRNGGFALSWWPKLASLTALIGERDAVTVAQDSERAIAEIGVFTAAHGIAADFRQGGWLWTATSQAQMGSWNGLLELCARRGVTPFRVVPPDQVHRLAGSPVHRAGILEGSAAVVQPAALARGLRRVALEAGVRVYEHSRVRHFTRDQPVVLTTDQGRLVAPTVVIATNAWAAGIRELGRSIAVISSDIVATAPIPEELAQLGWHPDLAITDSQIMVDYYRISNDRRIIFGKGGWTIGFGGRIGPRFDRHSRRAAEVTADFRRYYPSLGAVPITHDWSGPIDRTPTSLPLLGYLGGRRHLIYGVGWSGNGVGPSVVGGRVLASMALGRQDRWGQYPLIGRSAGSFPPEPIRFLGAHAVRTAVARKERREIVDAKPSWLATQIARLAPAGLEDKTGAP